MQSFILCGGTPDSRANYIADLTATQTELVHLAAEKVSLTIKQVQSLGEPLSIKARIPRVVWIEEANLLTVPAQNALLKMLEEPPENTSFYLTCHAASMLLPTIRSRCSKINLTTPTNLPNKPNILAELKQVMSLSAGDRLGSIVKRDRSESIIWLSEIETALRDKLREPELTPKSATTLAKIAKLALDAHAQLSANCSVSLVTQNFYLLLPHTRSVK